MKALCSVQLRKGVPLIIGREYLHRMRAVQGAIRVNVHFRGSEKSLQKKKPKIDGIILKMVPSIKFRQSSDLHLLGVSDVFPRTVQRIPLYKKPSRESREKRSAISEVTNFILQRNRAPSGDGGIGKGMCLEIGRRGT